MNQVHDQLAKWLDFWNSSIHCFAFDVEESR